VRRLLALALGLVIVLAAGIPAAHAETILEHAAEAAGTGELTRGLRGEERQILGDTDTQAAFDAQGALSRLWEHVLQRAKKELGAQFAIALRLLILIFFCALSEAVCDMRSAREGIVLAACCCAALLAAGDWNSGISQAAETLCRLSDYSRAALPVLYTAAAAAGAPTSAPIRYAASSLAMEVLMTVSRSLVLPFIHAYLALSLTLCICDDPLLRGVQRMIRKSAISILSLLTTAFCVYVGLSGLVAGSTDALAVKAARSVLSGMLPVVGGILSDSAAAIVSAAGVIRSAAGALCLVAVCAICAGPLVFLLIKLLLLRAAAAMAELLPGGALARFLNDCAGAFSLLLALVGSSAVMLFFSFMAGIRAVSG
jgi:stage III sporulation protein AE